MVDSTWEQGQRKGGYRFEFQNASGARSTFYSNVQAAPDKMQGPGVYSYSRGHSAHTLEGNFLRNYVAEKGSQQLYFFNRATFSGDYVGNGLMKQGRFKINSDWNGLEVDFSQTYMCCKEATNYKDYRKKVAIFSSGGYLDLNDFSWHGVCGSSHDNAYLFTIDDTQKRSLGLGLTSKGLKTSATCTTYDAGFENTILYGSQDEKAKAKSVHQKQMILLQGFKVSNREETSILRQVQQGDTIVQINDVNATDYSNLEDFLGAVKSSRQNNSQLTMVCFRSDSLDSTTKAATSDACKSDDDDDDECDGCL